MLLWSSVIGRFAGASLARTACPKDPATLVPKCPRIGPGQTKRLGLDCGGRITFEWTMAIRVGLVVVTFNSKSNFSRLKESLEAQTIPYRLIVVDNASAAAMRPTHGDLPAAAELISGGQKSWFRRRQQSCGRPVGHRVHRAAQPRCVSGARLVETLVAAADANIHAAAFGSTQIDARDETRYDGLGDCYHAFGVPWRGGYGHVRAGLPLQGQVFSPCAAAALYRRAAWQEVGGFDETFFCYCEDVDLGFRLRLAGHSILQVPQAVVRHVVAIHRANARLRSVSRHAQSTLDVSEKTCPRRCSGCFYRATSQLRWRSYLSRSSAALGHRHGAA